MRRRFPAAFLILVLALPALVRAEETPAPPDADTPPGWDAERFWFADVVGPAEAWTRIAQRVRQADRMRMRALQREMVDRYLEVWQGDAPDADDRLALATMLRYAERPGEALDVLGSVLTDTTVLDSHRTRAARDMGSLLALRRITDTIEAGEVADRVASVKRWLETEEGDRGSRASVLINLASWAAGADRLEEALELNLQAARTDASRSAQVGRSVKRLLMGSTIDLADYEPLREKVAAVFEELRERAQADLDALPEGAAEDRRKRAEAVVRLLEDGELPFEMLGRPAPAWTLDHAFSDVETLESLRGKVVVLDFWATWCGWCIKSFPAIRDLLRDYEDEGLVIVGVTTTHRTVYGSRFDLDDDMASKRGPGGRPVPAAVMAGGRPPPEGVPALEGEAYREKEREVLEGFLAAHEMTWPVVMIDKDEPKTKYALMGWPHAVVLDREGRVRFFKSGALLRDRPEPVAAFRKKLEALLAEAAEPPATE